MNLLERCLAEKAGYDNGFECVLTSDVDGVVLASACHANRVLIGLKNGIYQVFFQKISRSVLSRLQQSFLATDTADVFLVTGEANLAALLSCAVRFSRELQAQPADSYQQAVTAELACFPASTAGTEVERIVRLRVGQNKFRDAMLKYWGGACAVTGVAIPDVLRASHAKPWAECATDNERLDVFNGFLLSANLDALFDRFLISFDKCGALMLSPALAGVDLKPLGISSGMTLRWMETPHHPYLDYHRSRLIDAVNV